MSEATERQSEYLLCTVENTTVRLDGISGSTPLDTDQHEIRASSGPPWAFCTCLKWPLTLAQSQHRDRLPSGPKSFTRSCSSPQGAPTCTLHSTAAMPPRINIPPVTRILLITLGLQSILSAAIRYKQWSANSEIVIPYLNLIPQLSLIYPWTFLTTTLVESNVFTLAIAALTLFHGGRYLERAWSSKEFAKFLLITALIPNTLCFGVMVTFFTVTRNESWTYVSRRPSPLSVLERQQLTASPTIPG